MELRLRRPRPTSTARRADASPPRERVVGGRGASPEPPWRHLARRRGRRHKRGFTVSSFLALRTRESEENWLHSLPCATHSGMLTTTPLSKHAEQAPKSQRTPCVRLQGSPCPCDAHAACDAAVIDGSTPPLLSSTEMYTPLWTSVESGWRDSRQSSRSAARRSCAGGSAAHPASRAARLRPSSRATLA